MKGLGLQSVAAIWTLISYVVLGLPLSAFFCLELTELIKWRHNSEFVQQIHGMTGLYFGLDIALLVLLIQILQMISQLDWNDYGRSIFKNYLTHNQRQSERIEAKMRRETERIIDTER